MIKPQVKARVRKLDKAGFSIRSIARSLRVSRQSVRKILKEKETPEKEKPKQSPSRGKRSDPKKKRPSILDPFKGEIEAILEEHERVKKKIPSTKDLTTSRILKELQKCGYGGGRTILDDYLRSIRGPRRRDRVARRRFETGVGLEAQQDWSTYRVEIAGKVTKIQVFSLVLCWSRYQFLRAYPDQKQETLLAGHVAAFEYMGGITWRIVYDRQASISPCEIDGVPLIHETFEQFRAHYDFEIVLCRAGHKERKGKVEKVFLLFENDFLAARKFKSLEDLNVQLHRWLDGEDHPEDGNHRRHHTTGEIPHERWLTERDYLFELPRVHWLPRRVEKRSVNHDCTVRVEGTLYTVPARLVEKGVREVWVSLGGDDILIYDPGGEEVARHKRSREKGNLVIDERHYREIQRRKRRRRIPDLEREFLERFPRSAEFLAGLKRTVRSIAPIHLREILALARRYRSEEVEAALERALADSTTTSGYVRQLLARRHPTGHVGDIERERPKGLSLGPIDPGSSEGYSSIFQTAKEDNE